MAEQIKVLFAAAEVVPYAKVGGLADVAGALPKALEHLGLDVRVVMPLYGSVSREQFNLQEVCGPISVSMGEETETVTLWRAFLPDSEVEIYFLENQRFFHRHGVYADPKTGQGYADNALRFAFFNLALLEWIRKDGWRPDLIHGNDFHCGLIPAYLRTVFDHDPVLAGVKTVYSIHNLAYQGRFPREIISKIGLPQRLANPMEAMEFFGELNYMKAGLVFADVINTVSERYAQEIQQSAEFGVGLEGVLRSRSADLYGILNGVDYNHWNPEKDQLIAQRYGRGDLSGKRKNKSALLKAFGLPWLRKQHPLIGMISRLADQKGFDLILQASEEILALDLQLVILGTGQIEYHRKLQALQKRYPEKIGLALAFDNSLAHLIEAGADMFLMPSRYEPCGLNQMYSLRYGTIPIVRATGGLADTIRDVDQDPESGNGFVFEEYRADRMLAAIGRAVRAYADGSRWQKLVDRAMEADFSWGRSAQKYRQLYQRALEK
jgi:starch synthase